MPSKTTILVAVIGVAVIGFIVYYFFLSKKQTPQVQASTSPLSAIGSDVSSFVSGVQSAFSKVLSAGGTVMNDIKKDIGWGEKQLGNTVGIISSGASRFGKTVVSDTEHFVSSVEHVFGDAGKTLSGGVSDVEHAFKSGVKNVEKGASLLFIPTEADIQAAIKRILGVSQAPKEIMKEAKTISTGVEHGVDSFISGVKGLFSRF